MRVRAWTALAAPLLLLLAASAPAEDPVGRHNMMMVGEKTLFLSHLPMFEALDETGTAYATVHRYQVILEATLTRGGRDVTRVYGDDRRAHPGERMYTLQPAEDFVLPHLFHEGAGPHMESFPATVFRGHLERDPHQRIRGLGNVRVNVRRVIRAQRFEPSTQSPRNLTYILFGRGNELFLAHAIARPPDFDQILAVTVDGHAFTDDELGRGVEVVFADRANTATARLRQGESAAGRFRVAGAGEPRDLRVRARTEHYFEEGELAMPPKFGTTREEQRSGF